MLLMRWYQLPCRNMWVKKGSREAGLLKLILAGVRANVEMNWLEKLEDVKYSSMKTSTLAMMMSQFMMGKRLVRWVSRIGIIGLSFFQEYSESFLYTK